MVGYKKDLAIKEERISGNKSDFFIWLVHNIIDYPNGELGNNSGFFLKELTGFRGSSEDDLRIIEGSGKKISDMLTTLLFLFENQNISKVQIKVEKNRHKFVVTLGEDSLVELDLKSYNGPDMLGQPEEVESRILLRTFIELIPKLIRIFSEEQSSNKWTLKKEEKFFDGIGIDLKKSLNKVLKERREKKVKSRLLCKMYDTLF